ncbi:MAG: rhodanese-like domain-containing protein [Myxococcota bacterium]
MTSTTVDDPLIPPIGAMGQVERFFRVTWVDSLERSPSGVPLHTPEYVARQGRSVRLIDIRTDEELTGPLGFIPGVDVLDRALIPTLPERLHRDSPLIIISRGSERAMEAARLLEQKGMRMVAAMRGGMIAWKDLGFATLHDPTIVARRNQLREIQKTVEQERKPLTREEVEAHIGDVFSVRWLRFAAMLLHGRLSCVDGRDETGVVGTPGGDGGEFMLALAGLETVLDRELTAAEVETLARRRLDTFGRFYVHTDIGSANMFIKSMRTDRRLDHALKNVFETMEWRRFLRGPPLEVRELVLEHLLGKPEHLGCGHIRLALQHEDLYGMRKGLIITMLKALFRTRWNGSTDFEYTPLPGGHLESAVINVRVDDDQVHPFTQLPLVSPNAFGRQMFVNHPQVSRYLRGQLVHFLAMQNDLFTLSRDAEASLLHEVESMARRQARATLSRLAAGLPVYDVTFRRDGKVDVVSAGSIPGTLGGGH